MSIQTVLEYLKKRETKEKIKSDFGGIRVNNLEGTACNVFLLLDRCEIVPSFEFFINKF